MAGHKTVPASARVDDVECEIPIACRPGTPSRLGAPSDPAKRQQVRAAVRADCSRRPRASRRRHNSGLVPHRARVDRPSIRRPNRQRPAGAGLETETRMICQRRTTTSQGHYREEAGTFDPPATTVSGCQEYACPWGNVPEPQPTKAVRPTFATTTASAFLYISHARTSAATARRTCDVVQQHGLEVPATAIDITAPPQRMSRADRYERLRELIELWLADDSGYDEEVWPQVKAGIEASRMSSRKRFSE